MNTYFIERTILYKVQDRHIKNLMLTALELQVSLKRFERYEEFYPDGKLTRCRVGRIIMNLPKKNLDKYVAIIRLGVHELQCSNHRQLEDQYDFLYSCLESPAYSEHDHKLIEILMDYVNGNYACWDQDYKRLLNSIMEDINSVK